MTWDDYCDKIAEIAEAGLDRIKPTAGTDDATELATAGLTQRRNQEEHIRAWNEDMRNERWQDSVAGSDALRSNLDSLLRRVQTETALTKRRWVSLRNDVTPSRCISTDYAIQPTKTLFR